MPLKISRYTVVRLQQLRCVHLMQCTETCNCGDHKLKLRQKPVEFSFMHGSDAERENKSTEKFQAHLGLEPKSFGILVRCSYH